MRTEAAALECGRCHARYRVRDPRVLRPGLKRRCRSCGSAFAVVTPSTQRSLAGPHDFSQASRTYRFSFHGAGKTLLGMQAVNVCLTLLTLGLYHFWAKVKIRRYLFSQASCAGDRFAYHGSGRELLIGFLRAMAIFGVPYALLTTLPEFLSLSGRAKVAAGWAGALLVMIYVPLAIVGARRYRMCRTTWRGIKFSFRGRAWEFVLLTLKGTLLTAMTLGVYYPHYHAARIHYLVSHSYFGNVRFEFDGRGWELSRIWTMVCFVSAILGVLLVIMLTNRQLFFRLLPGWALNLTFFEVPRWVWVTFWSVSGLALTQWWIYFLAAKQRFLWNHTSLAGARFHSTVTYRSLVTLYAGNLLLLVPTLGIAWPWVTTRTTAFYLTNLSFRGTPDLSQIQQDSHGSSATGEGLANFLDTGFELD